MPEKEEQKQPELTERIRHWATTIRDSLIVLLLLLLLIWPAFINDRLKDAGFTEADIAGFHWQNQLLEATEQTGEAQQQVEAARESIDSVRQSLDEITRSVEDEAVKTKVLQLTTQIDNSLQTVRSVDQDLKASMQVQQELLQRTVPTAIPKESDRWGIIISSDKDVPSTEHEFRRAVAAGYKQVSVYQKDGWYRTAIEFSSKERALKTIKKIQSELQESAYLVDLEQWCPEPDEGERKGWYVCITS